MSNCHQFSQNNYVWQGVVLGQVEKGEPGILVSESDLLLLCNY